MGRLHRAASSQRIDGRPARAASGSERASAGDCAAASPVDVPEAPSSVDAIDESSAAVVVQDWWRVASARRQRALVGSLIAGLDLPTDPTAPPPDLDALQTALSRPETVQTASRLFDALQPPRAAVADQAAVVPDAGTTRATLSAWMLAFFPVQIFLQDTAETRLLHIRAAMLVSTMQALKQWAAIPAAQSPTGAVMAAAAFRHLVAIYAAARDAYLAAFAAWQQPHRDALVVAEIERYLRQRVADRLDPDARRSATASQGYEEAQRAGFLRSERRLRGIGGEAAVERLHEALWEVHDVLPTHDPVALVHELALDPEFRWHPDPEEFPDAHVKRQVFERLRRDLAAEPPILDRVPRMLAHLREALLRMTPIQIIDDARARHAHAEAIRATLDARGLQEQITSGSLRQEVLVRIVMAVDAFVGQIEATARTERSRPRVRRLVERAGQAGAQFGVFADFLEHIWERIDMIQVDSANADLAQLAPRAWGVAVQAEADRRKGAYDLRRVAHWFRGVIDELEPVGLTRECLYATDAVDTIHRAALVQLLQRSEPLTEGTMPETLGFETERLCVEQERLAAITQQAAALRLMTVMAASIGFRLTPEQIQEAHDAISETAGGVGNLLETQAPDELGRRVVDQLKRFAAAGGRGLAAAMEGQLAKLAAQRLIPGAAHYEESRRALGNVLRRGLLAAHLDTGWLRGVGLDAVAPALEALRARLQMAAELNLAAHYDYYARLVRLGRGDEVMRRLERASSSSSSAPAAVAPAAADPEARLRARVDELAGICAALTLLQQQLFTGTSVLSDEGLLSRAEIAEFVHQEFTDVVGGATVPEADLEARFMDALRRLAEAKHVELTEAETQRFVRLLQKTLRGRNPGYRVYRNEIMRVVRSVVAGDGVLDSLQQHPVLSVFEAPITAVAQGIAELVGADQPLDDTGARRRALHLITLRTGSRAGARHR